MASRRLPRLVTSVLATCSLALAATACGSDASTSTDADSSTGATAATGGATATAEAGVTLAPPSDAPAASGAPATSAATPPSDAAPAPEALRFAATLVGGGGFEGGAYGERPVAFWFWAPT